jgi:hypothetical protein
MLEFTLHAEGSDNYNIIKQAEISLRGIPVLSAFSRKAVNYEAVKSAVSTPAEC